MKNAINYSSKNGTIKVYSSESPKRFFLLIKDYGKGMPNLFAQKLTTFDVDNPENVGIPVANKVMNLFGGSIEVSSQERSNMASDDPGTLICLKFPKR